MQQRDTSKSQAKHDILYSIYSYIAREKIISVQFMQQFDSTKTGNLKFEDFLQFVQINCKNVNPAVAQELYSDLLKNYRCSTITTFVIDQITRNMAKDYPIQGFKRERNAEEILQLAKKVINYYKSSVQVFFKFFDKDKDEVLNEKELSEFLRYLVPTITEQEFLSLFPLFKSQQVTSIQLQMAIQDADSLLNSIRLKDSGILVKEDLSKQQKPQIKKQQNKKNFEVQESNIYDDPNSMLKSDIQFEDQTNKIPVQSVEGLQLFIDTMNMLKKNQITNFQDSSFNIKMDQKFKNYQYLKAKEMKVSDKQEPKIFGKEIETSRKGLGKWISQYDILQGELGDCYFLSSVSALAFRYPEVIFNLFIVRKANPIGIYCLKLCIDGIWQAIILDDYFPCRNGQPAFTRCKDNELWVMLIEKAWAKVFGSYSIIEAGNSKEVFKALTGAPTSTLFTDDKDFLEKLIVYKDKKYPMTSGTFKKMNNQDITQTEFNQMGLVPGHAYSILRVKYLKNPKTKQMVYLFKLGNPWGQKEWRGEWRDEDNELWNEETRAQACRHNDKISNDGVFYMEQKDFVTYFQDIEVCLYNEKYLFQGFNYISTKKNALWFQFDAQTPGEYFFSIVQQSDRFYKGKSKNYEYSPAKLILIKQEGNRYFVQDGKFLKSKDVFVGGQLEKGRYYLYAKVKWLFWNEHDFNLTTYGIQNVKLRQITKVANLLQQAFQNLAEQNKDRKQYEPQIEKCHSFNLDNGFGYIYFENNSKKQLDSQIKLTKSEGLKLKKPEKGQSFNAVVNPGEKKMVLMSINIDGFNFATSESFVTKQVR